MAEKMYLRKRDLVEAMGMKRGTLSDWVAEYHMFMPTVKHGNVTYYKPEALDVLRAIKEIKEAGYLFKPDIVPQLMNRGFAITAEEIVDDLQRTFSQPDTRDGMVKVVAELHRQGEALELLEERADGFAGRISEHDERMDGQDGRIQTVEEKQDEQGGRMTDLERMVKELAEQLVATQAEAAAAKERAERAESEASKPWWRRWK